MQKKGITIISLMLVIIILFSCSYNVIAAEDSFKLNLTTSTTSVKQGGQITFDVYLQDININTGDKGIVSIDATASYDTEVFSGISSITAAEGWTKLFSEDDLITFSKDGLEVITSNQIIATVVLDVKEDAKIGNTAVKFGRAIGTSGSTEIEGTSTDTIVNIELNDTKAPTISYSNLSNSTPSKSQSVTVTVDDGKNSSGINNNSLKYLWSTSMDSKPADSEFVNTFENGGVITKNNGDGEYYLWTQAADNAGHTSTYAAGTYLLDNTAPEITQTYEIEHSDTVVVILTSNEELQEVEGWTLSTDKKVLRKGYTEDVKEDVVVKDIAGNQTVKNIELVGVGKEDLFIVSVSYSNSNLTKDSVTVTITSNLELQELTGWELSNDKLSLTRTYDNNIEEEVEVKNKNGNSVIKTISITNIDKTALGATVSYNITEMTMSNVVVTITANKAVQDLPGWTKSEDEKVLTREFNTNVNQKIVIYDYVGNEYSVDIIIENIDNTPAEVSITYSTKELTNKDVEVTLTTNEEVRTISGWTLSADKKKLTKTYTKNTEETVTVTDLIGNTTTGTVSIKNIDKVAPVVTVSYSTTATTKSPVEVTITSNKELQELTGWTLSTDKLKLTKSYRINATQTITVYDLAGNSVDAQVKITNIDIILNKGDINGDSIINMTDVISGLRYIAVITSESIATKHPDWVLYEEEIEALDVDSSGATNITDIIKMLRHIAATSSTSVATKHPDWKIVW